MRDIDAAYYGFRDDDDGLLVPLEVVAEKAAIDANLKKWKEKQHKRQLESQAQEDEEETSKDKKKKTLYTTEEELDEGIMNIPEKSETDRLEEAMEAGKEARYVSYIEVPSQDDIKEALLRRKKQELLMHYDLEDEEQHQENDNVDRENEDIAVKKDIKTQLKSP